MAGSCHAQEQHYKNYHLALAELIRANRAEGCRFSVNIDKSEYKLRVLADTIVLKEYPVVFGKNPTGDKLIQGDKCTPEGSFKMISKYPHKKWSKFIWINYPNDESWIKHNRAKAEGTIPGNARIGGEIGIHGVPDGMDFLIDMRYNWTLGCIAMKNKDIDELYPYITEDVTIKILK